MKNEIGRKITSLTLMTIMIAGGMTFAIPGILPQASASHNANLFVSAENSAFDNTFGGPMVIEILINDDTIRSLDDAHGQPDVTINGKQIVMAQATDGNWYAYVADRDQVQTADNIPNTSGTSLDFGSLCDNDDDFALDGQTLIFSESVGVAFPVEINDANNGTSGEGPAHTVGTITTGCTITTNGTLGKTFTSSDTVINVIREAKTLNTDADANGIGQIQLNQTALFPFTQLYQFNPTGNVVIQYNKGGNIQTTTLTFDTTDVWAVLGADRTSLPQNAEVHFTITDQQLNIDPTDEDSWTFATNATNATATFYQIFNENGDAAITAKADVADVAPSLATFLFEDNGVLIINIDAQGTGAILAFDDNDNQIIAANGSATTAGGAVELITINNGLVTMTELGPNSAIFANYDELDNANVDITSTALRGTSAIVDYNDTPVSIVVANDFGVLDMDGAAVGDEWNSGEEIPVTLVDQDLNLNTRSDEDLDLNNADVPLIPSLQIGSPITLEGASITLRNSTDADILDGGVTIALFSQIANLGVNTETILGTDSILNVTYTGTDGDALGDFLADGDNNALFHLFSYDIRSLEDTFSSSAFSIVISNVTDTSALILTSSTTDYQGLIDISPITGTGAVSGTDTAQVHFTFEDASSTISAGSNFTMVADFFSFGTSGDGITAADRTNNAIYRMELEETGDNTATYIGSVEYIMLNQLNVNQTSTYTAIAPISDEIVIIVHEDLTDEDSPRINYLDLGADGVSTQIADQQEAPSHSGIVSLDLSTYKVADTVVVTLDDQDLNVDSDLIDIFTVVNSIGDAADERVGIVDYGVNSFDDPFGSLLFITFDDALWTDDPDGDGVDNCSATLEDGLVDTGFTLVETGPGTGVFKGDFQVPPDYCISDTATASTTGTDIEVNYLDYRDASGEIIEVGDGAGIRANTGSVSLDRTVYPVPFGDFGDFGGNTVSTPNQRSLFPIHQTGMSGIAGLETGETLGTGDLTIHVRINDPDFDISAMGEDIISTITNRTQLSGAFDGPVKIMVSRGADVLTLATAGGTAASGGDTVITTSSTVSLRTVELGPITETAPDSAIFELDMTVKYTDGPLSAICPATVTYTSPTNSSTLADALQRFDAPEGTATDYCILQGDIITVEYTDPTDASGNPNTVTDSATFDLRNGVLQSDKSVYIIGGDLILTLIEPDFDLENDAAETYDLDLIEWDSDAATTTMGNQGSDAAAFDPEPSAFRETGDSTGIFQIVIEIPNILSGDNLERGEEIVLEYTDWGPSGADYVGNEDEDINLTIFTSNFGATVELDQKVYTWTDKVYITIVAPDHNFDSNLIDEIGDTGLDPVKVSTRGQSLNNYKLVETGTDTGIFTGEVILSGFSHDADGDLSTGTATTGFDTSPITGTSTGATASGPTDGFLETDDDDGITVSFEFSEDETVIGSALVRWNIGEAQWLEASYPASGTGVIRIVDPDMNLNPESVDNFNVDVWSDSDAGGIDLTVTETNEATGIFEGTVFFTTTDESSGHRLRVAEGDTITAEYEDNTLPDPYTTADELDITGTSLIGTIVPPLERAPAANARVVDAFGNALAAVSVDQQVQITADLANGQDRDQLFAYLVQVQDSNGVTVSLAWITGSLSAGQSFSPALSWTPDAAGTYTATVFVWESVNNPTALSPPTSVDIDVS